MTVNKRKKSKLPIILVIVAVLLAALAFAGVQVYDYLNRQYKLNTHPIKYEQYVEDYAAEYDVDKYLLYAIIKTESGFDENAVSNVGARGLMQIMEETFDWIKFRLGDETQTYDDMFTPEENIRYGAYLIDYLCEYFGSTDCAVAAYHAGVGSVDGWLSNPEYSSDGVTLDKIPISDTAHYLDKITNAYNIYIELYNGGNKNG